MYSYMCILVCARVRAHSYLSVTCVTHNISLFFRFLDVINNCDAFKKITGKKKEKKIVACACADMWVMLTEFYVLFVFFCAPEGTKNVEKKPTLSSLSFVFFILLPYIFNEK